MCCLFDPQRDGLNCRPWHDGKLSEVLECISVHEQELTTDSPAWYNLRPRDSAVFSPACCRSIKPSFPVTTTGTGPHQSSCSGGIRVRKPLLQPWANGLLSPSTWMRLFSLCLLWALRSSRKSSYKSTNAPLLHRRGIGSSPAID